MRIKLGLIKDYILADFPTAEIHLHENVFIIVHEQAASLL